MRREWTKAETEKAIRLKLQGMSYYEIADELGRSLQSTSVKLSRLQIEGRITASSVPQSSYPLWTDPLRSEGDAVILTDVEAPYQHSEFINRVLDLADAWNVRTLHLAGDLLHYSNLSAWGSEWTENKSDMLDMFMEIIEQAVAAKKRDAVIRMLEEKGMTNEGGLSGELAEARKVFRSFHSFDNILVAIGNHDDRYIRTLGQAVASTELLHQLDRHNDERWKIAPYYFTVIDTEQGQFRIEHPRGAGKNAAIDLAVQYHTHIVMGHSHRWNVSRDPSGKFWAIQTGHCVDERRLAYVQQRSAKRDAHVLGATIIRDGFPFVLCPETPWDKMKRM